MADIVRRSQLKYEADGVENNRSVTDCVLALRGVFTLRRYRLEIPGTPPDTHTLFQLAETFVRLFVCKCGFIQSKMFNET